MFQEHERQYELQWLAILCHLYCIPTVTVQESCQCTKSYSCLECRADTSLVHSTCDKHSSLDSTALCEWERKFRNSITAIANYTPDRISQVYLQIYRLPRLSESLQNIRFLFEDILTFWRSFHSKNYLLC